MTFDDLIRLLEVSVWPLAVFTALVIFRRPLQSLLADLGGRVTKISILQFSFELTPLAESSPRWSAEALGDFRNLSPSHVFDSPSWTLFQQLTESTGRDFVAVDIGKGTEWLTSRLFIFAVLLGRMVGLRCFIFVQSDETQARRFLGLATTDEVHWTLAARYPWLEKALAQAYADQLSGVAETTPFLKESHGLFVNPHDLRRIGEIFLQRIQQPSPGKPVADWVSARVGNGPEFVEHAHWIDAARLNRDFVEPLSRNSSIVNDPHASLGYLVRSVAGLEGDFVALLNSRGQFRSLVDRRDLIERVSRDAVERAQAQVGESR